ncbi:hypothetical protein Nepgr_027721 [Nepenthes gracilis]|uniref:Uncharacterized protein n=1 Tax=Nepenthes gracilis TaxID=150966 RepID=A0AAD3T9B2_NEPGR|nr:hypothetical protein Nepgr_027721 [Nepenthes gracilis]
MQHGKGHPANQKSTSKSNNAHQVVAPKNLTPDVVSAQSGYPFSLDDHHADEAVTSTEPGASNANNKAPVDTLKRAPDVDGAEDGTSILVSLSANVGFDSISPKANVEYLVNSAPASGMSGGLVEHSLVSDMNISTQEVTCSASGDKSTSGSGPASKSHPTIADASTAPGTVCSATSSIGMQNETMTLIKSFQSEGIPISPSTKRKPHTLSSQPADDDNAILGQLMPGGGVLALEGIDCSQHSSGSEQQFGFCQTTPAYSPMVAANIPFEAVCELESAPGPLVVPADQLALDPDIELDLDLTPDSISWNLRNTPWMAKAIVGLTLVAMEILWILIVKVGCRKFL